MTPVQRLILCRALAATAFCAPALCRPRCSARRRHRAAARRRGEPQRRRRPTRSWPRWTARPIHLSDVKDAVQSAARRSSAACRTQMLYPMLLDQLIDGAAAGRRGAASRAWTRIPTVQRQMQRPRTARCKPRCCNKEVGPPSPRRRCTRATSRNRRQARRARRCTPATSWWTTEAEAKKIIAQLKGGGDFAALAKQYSKDPGAAQQGGDLGLFKKDDMVPEFANAAFALKPGQVIARRRCTPSSAGT